MTSAWTLPRLNRNSKGFGLLDPVLLSLLSKFFIVEFIVEVTSFAFFPITFCFSGVSGVDSEIWVQDVKSFQFYACIFLLKKDFSDFCFSHRMIIFASVKRVAKGDGDFEST